MKTKNFLARVGLALMAAIILGALGGLIARNEAKAANGTYKILAWNDLGMHCYSQDFSDLAVLPPYNTLWVQVIKAGDPPSLVTTGITVEYFYADNTYSVGKTNFWSYSQPLFGVALAPNIGLKGKGLSGTMDLSLDHFVAEGIPVTEFSDSAPTTSQPYQLATVVVKDSTTGAELARTRVVTPVSSEMRCDTCHGDTGQARPNQPTGKVETNILQLHDEEEGTSLMTSRPVLCANCHGSNALGMPGKPGLPNLSNAMHSKHDGESPNTQIGCYNCHPGPQTKCLRDTMSTQGMTCISCHGGMSTVKNNPNPWLNEPRCDTCHNSGQYNQNHPLYRFSTEHGGLYCEACHDSTHAVAPSREANDAIKFIALQGKNGPIDQCQVCHITVPTSGTGPHGTISPPLTVLSITRLNPTPTSAASVNFTVIFSESVTGVDIVAPFNDFALITTGGVSGATVSGVSGSGSTYTVTANTGSGNGTIRLDVVDNNSIVDATSNPLGGAGVGDGNFTTGEFYSIIKSTGNGGDTTGVFRPGNGLLYLKNANTTGFADVAINYGLGGDYPIAGDWDGNGTTTIGIYRNGSFYLRNSNTLGFADIVFAFGTPGDQPIAGDWDGDGVDTIGVYSNGQFLLRNSNSAGTADMSFYLGNPGDVGIAGDWNGDGSDTTGVFRPSNGVIFLKNLNTTGFADININYGLSGDMPVIGDWNNDMIDTIGVYRNAQFLLRNSNTIGFADIVFALGNPGDMPISGNWDGIP